MKRLSLLLVFVAIYSCTSVKSNEEIYSEKIITYFQNVSFEPDQYRYESFQVVDTIQNLDGVRLWLLIDHQYGYVDNEGNPISQSTRLEIVHFPGKECLVFPEGETGMNYPNTSL